jgi:hypothetical protein
VVEHYLDTVGVNSSSLLVTTNFMPVIKGFLQNHRTDISRLKWNILVRNGTKSLAKSYQPARELRYNWIMSEELFANFVEITPNGTLWIRKGLIPVFEGDKWQVRDGSQVRDSADDEMRHFGEMVGMSLIKEKYSN